MKKSSLFIVACLFALGCSAGHDKPGTCPHRKDPQAAPADQPAPDADQTKNESREEAPQPASTGYGEDPGEETQE